MESVPTRIVDERRLELGEGPSYDALTDTAAWFDILGRTLYEMPLSTGTVTAHALPRMASEIAAIDATRQLLAMEDGLYIRDRASGALTLHLPLEADDPNTRSNDGNVHPSGALWVGTMGKGAEREAGTIYHYRKGVLTPLYRDISIPNAIAFTEDGRTGYFCDTVVNKLMRVALDPATGLPIAEPELFHDQTQHEGGLDGACVARDGTLVIACWSAGSLLVLSPSGETLRTIEVPSSQPTCPAFIGRKADRLLVTTAWEHMTPDQQSTDASAGMTFILDIGLEGRHVPQVVIE
ncbi:SMP-30/gluconolactonase/LRE family protein [Fulvimarina sp. 2208YS6-2-32]|uniref:SMP-30/gluconolactonase/LRE family protein n=1 Tax=Fulvimarina uroteuthidis TaxID=3098149 RepID=A0ABU5HZQ1_9HYPH|nr:SMP-30/gluconolactonase/LRE family protein [Fulvimarina sp. 2208YS6-2-32]MDY8108616.1 SMP-30/gluconolactonase/LRE family protein [Fulvimarina sp. 2208YS6-2-32]